MASGDPGLRAFLNVRSDDRVDAERSPAFLRMRRIRVRVEREDGWTTEEGTWDFVERPMGLDAVVVVVFRRAPGGVEVLLRKGLRVPAALGREGQPSGPGRHPAVFIDELVAGLIERGENDDAGRLRRASLEVAEEAGLRVDPGAVVPLGGPLWATPGICAEVLYYYAADATGCEAEPLVGDGSPFEAIASTTWLPLTDALARVSEAPMDAGPADIGDARAEIGLRRLAAHLARAAAVP